MCAMKQTEDITDVIKYLKINLSLTGKLLQPKTVKVRGKNFENLVFNQLPILESCWYRDELWAAWATPLDDSTLWYVLPDEYDTLMSLTGKTQPYMNAICDKLPIRILGTAGVDDKSRGNSFWKEGLPVEGILCQWAKAVHEDMACPGREIVWRKAYKEALAYFQRHRHLVRCAGRMLDIDMENHDLTKTSMFQYALGYLWHWSGEQSSEMKAMAWKVVRERHLCQEDHHPEYNGKVNPCKLFTDRLAVGIQKSKIKDDQGGWNIDAWIPEQFKSEWARFREQNGHLNMYSILDQDILELPEMDVTVTCCGIASMCNKER